MQITIDRKDHIVYISDDYPRFTDLSMSPSDALALLKALESKRDELNDLATNYYDCKECGQTHHKSVKDCPSLSQEI